MTLDVWTIPPESARRVGHPAPFPVELPEQLIRLYTFKDDLVLDPFMGSGSTLVAAARLGRRYAGYDLDAGYVEIARAARRAGPGHRDRRWGRRRADEPEPLAARLVEDGLAAQKVAEQALEEAGFSIVERDRRIRGTGVSVSFVAEDAGGTSWFFDVVGPFTRYRGGLARTDAVWRSLGRACAVRRARGGTPLVLLTTHLPRRPSEGDTALRAAGPDAVFDVIELLSMDGLERLARYAKGELTTRPEPGFWTAAELARREP